MVVDLNLIHWAGLLADRSRLIMLDALMGNLALPASDLAHRAGITNATASAHLAKLQDAGLVAVQRQGRHRYYHLASVEIAAKLEQLNHIAPAPPVKPGRGPQGDLRRARLCYDHLAGLLGVQMTDALRKTGALAWREGDFRLTAKGKSYFTEMGIDCEMLPRRRKPLSACLDWSERRPHLGGALGAALADHCLKSGWVRRQKDSRALIVTPAGTLALRQHWKIELPT